jgi:hypothetical protein
MTMHSELEWIIILTSKAAQWIWSYANDIVLMGSGERQILYLVY